MKPKTPEVLKSGSAYALDKHRRIVCEMPRHVERQINNIAARNKILNATQAINARLERGPVMAHLHRMPAGLQSLAARHHIKTLNQKIHHLANKGLSK